jgi:5,10-methylenetetrahydromethanopterin reductase
MGSIKAGADRAGRKLHEIDVTGCVIVSIDEETKRAKDAIRPLVATYLAAFPNIAAESSVPEADLNSIRGAFSSGNVAGAMQYVTDEIVDELTCSGTREECRARIGERRAAGVAMPILFIAAGDAKMALEDLASA